MADSRQRTKFNLQLPVEVMKAFDDVAERYGHGRRWIAMTAGVAMFLALSKEKQDVWMKRIMEAEIEGDFSGFLPKDRPLRVARINSKDPAASENPKGSAQER